LALDGQILFFSLQDTADKRASHETKGPNMPLYEHIFLARPDITSQQVDTLIEQYKGVIETAGGKITKNEYWGVKSLAYRVRKNRKAHFTLLNVEAPSSALSEVERLMSINEDVIRYMTIRVDALDDGPSAMMQKKERSDKRRRDEDGEEGEEF
jgi:small subunit ribosomal protein S6